MATFWQGNWARSPQQQSGLQQISQSVPPPEKPSPHTARQKNKKEEEDRRTRKKKQALRQRIYIHRRGNSLLRPKRKEAQERKTRNQERSTRKKHWTTYNTKQNLTTKNNTYRLQRGKIYSGKGNSHCRPPLTQYPAFKWGQLFCLPSVAHSDLQAQILKFLSRCWKFIHRPHSTQPRTRSASSRNPQLIHPPGIEEIRRLTFRNSGQKSDTARSRIFFTWHAHLPPSSVQLPSAVTCFKDI